MSVAADIQQQQQQQKNIDVVDHRATVATFDVRLTSRHRSMLLTADR
jgi:hypothetical protein